MELGRTVTEFTEAVKIPPEKVKKITETAIYEVYSTAFALNSLQSQLRFHGEAGKEEYQKTRKQKALELGEKLLMAYEQTEETEE